MPNWRLDEVAGPRRVRPGIETPAPEGFLRRPDLLQGRPMIGRALRAEQPGAVRGLEAVVHLEAAPEGRTAVRPAALVAVNAHELPQVRRVLSLPTGRPRHVPPAHERRL